MQHLRAFGLSCLRFCLLFVVPSNFDLVGPFVSTFVLSLYVCIALMEGMLLLFCGSPIAVSNSEDNPTLFLRLVDP